MEVKEGHVLAILPPYQHITKRDYIWPYSLALMSETVVAYCHKDINIFDYLGSSSKKNSAPLNIGVNAGYMILGEKIMAAGADKKILVWENKSTRSNLLKLQLKRIDCYINDRFSIQYELAKLSKLRDLNYKGLTESMVVMRQTAHIGYTDSIEHNFAFKSDFVHRMDSALTQVKASAQYQAFITKYLPTVKAKLIKQ
jgi:polar amino acid transport system substrate-binding protein